MKKKLIIALAIVVAVGGISRLVSMGKRNLDVIASGRVTRYPTDGGGWAPFRWEAKVAPLTEGLVDQY